MNPGLEPRYLNLEYWFNLAISAVVYLLRLLFDFAYWVERHRLENLAIFFILIFLAGNIYVLHRLYRLRRKTIRDFTNILEVEQEPEKRKARWQEIAAHLTSETPAEWKIAILEADALIDEILTRVGYRGENLGERLKSIEPSDFESIEDVWEAHKVRNRIAHEPGYNLTQPRAREVIAKYEKALKELKYL